MINLYEYSLQKVYEYVSGPKNPTDVSLNFRCPFCGDSAKNKRLKRGHLYKKDASYHCFNCGRSYGAYKFLAYLQSKDISDIKRDIYYEYRDLPASSLLKHVFINDEEEINLSQSQQSLPTPTEIRLKESWVDLEKSDIAVKIIEDRLINKAPYLPRKWRLYYETNMKRIVIPWYRGGKIQYYQCRAIYKNQTQKYLFPKDASKDIFGLDDLDPDYPYILYQEGVFDAIFVKNCIAIGGLKPTLKQMDLLESYLINKELVLFPDNPWIDEASKDNIFKLAARSPNSLVYAWPKSCTYKDVNELVIANNDPNWFTNEIQLEKRFIKASKYKIMLLFGKDII